MSGDYSRFIFDPTLDYHGVQLQQGRPLTDWDWNDATAEINRRQQADSYDTFGQAVVPSTTKDAFAIKLGGGSFSIGPGRMYVDGLLAENHGTDPQAWDPAMAELVGTGWVPYLQQPYLPNPPALPTGGLNLVYLDVWQREVTWIEAPGLVEPALGVDTTTRIQTVWQVKLLTNVDGGTTCSTPLDQVSGWNDHTAPSAGRLTNATGAPTSDDPCQIPPAGGYKGLENQLYRIEIHAGGTFGAATFKWSRNNASIVANVIKLIGTKTLVVDSVGKDSVLQFNDGDWVEITDDWRELNNLPGEMHRIVIGGGVDDATRTITLQTDINAAWFPSGTLQERHTRLKRWDQQGKVLKADGTVYVDLDTTADGLIPVPAAGTQISVEAGILINFDLVPTGGQFKSADYWMFAARAATANIDPLKQAPPRGIHHHYVKLGLTNLNDTPQDCRVPWPPAFGGESCACTVCVTAAAHNAGTGTIQQAITAVINGGGGTVCLEPGTYNVNSTMTITGAGSLRIRGHGPATQLVAAIDTVFKIDTSLDVGFGDFALQLAATGDGVPMASVGFGVGNVETLNLSRLDISSAESKQTRTDTAVQLGGSVAIADISGCAIDTDTGIAAVSNLEQERGYAGSVLRITDNVFKCTTVAVNAPQIMSLGELLVQCNGNSVSGCSDAGFRFGTGDDERGRIEINDNRVLVGGSGIIGTLSGLDIRDNEVHYQAPETAPPRPVTGIAIGDPQNVAQITVDDLRIFGNRIGGFTGVAISAAVPLGTAMLKSNRLENVGAGILLAGSNTGAVSIENNQLSDIRGLGAGDAALVFGIGVNGAPSLQIRDNSLSRLATTASGTLFAGAIYVAGCGEVCIDGNSIVDLAPQASFEGDAIGIWVSKPFVDAALHDNQIVRSSAAATADGARWCAIAVAPDSAVAVNVAGGEAKPAKGAAKKTVATGLATSPAQVRQAKLSELMKIAKLPEVMVKTAVAAAAPHQRTLVRGNQLSGYGGISIVQIGSANDCDFSGNQCLTVPMPDSEQSPADVTIDGTALVINGNRVSGSSRLSIALTSPPVKGVSAAVVGNITRGRIALNNSPLPANWLAVNIADF